MRVSDGGCVGAGEERQANADNLLECSYCSAVWVLPDGTTYAVPEHEIAFPAGAARSAILSTQDQK